MHLSTRGSLSQRLRRPSQCPCSVRSSEEDNASSRGNRSGYESYSDISSSDESTDAEPAASELSDQHDMLEHAYEVASDAFHVCPDGTLVGGAATLHAIETFPSHWPFAKMTLPQHFFVDWQTQNSEVKEIQ